MLPNVNEAVELWSLFLPLGSLTYHGYFMDLCTLLWFVGMRMSCIQKKIGYGDGEGGMGNQMSV